MLTPQVGIAESRCGRAPRSQRRSWSPSARSGSPPTSTRGWSSSAMSCRRTPWARSWRTSWSPG